MSDETVPPHPKHSEAPRAELLPTTIHCGRHDDDFAKPAREVPEERLAACHRFVPYHGEYEIREEIGRGGMGVVYRGYDRKLDREVAIKTIRPTAHPSDRATFRFLKEAKVTGQLQHPGIPPVHELGELPDGRPFLAMKLVGGRTWAELLDEEWSQATGGSLAPNAFARLINLYEQLCHTVGYAHTNGIIHRDLKPSNIMVGNHGEVQVMDWGLAKTTSVGDLSDAHSHADDDLVNAGGLGSESRRSCGEDTGDSDSNSVTRTGELLGTPAYMSPEQAAGEWKTLDPRTDVFSLGAILYELLCGRPLYIRHDGDARGVVDKSEVLARANEQLSAIKSQPAFAALCRRCLAIDREERPTDGYAVAAEVAAIRAAVEEQAREADLRLHRSRLMRRAAVGALFATMLLACLSVISFVQWRRADRNEQLAQDRLIIARRNEALARQQTQIALEALSKIIVDLQTGVFGAQAMAAASNETVASFLNRLDQAGAAVASEPSSGARSNAALFPTPTDIARFTETVQGLADSLQDSVDIDAGDGAPTMDWDELLSQPREQLSRSIVVRIRQLAKLGPAGTPEAIRAADKLAELAQDAPPGEQIDQTAGLLYHAASGYALAAKLASGWRDDGPFSEPPDRSLTPEERAQINHCLSRAMQCLRAAVQAGWHDLPTLMANPDFSMLRGRDDFQSLVRKQMFHDR